MLIQVVNVLPTIIVGLMLYSVYCFAMSTYGVNVLIRSTIFKEDNWGATKTGHGPNCNLPV